MSKTVRSPLKDKPLRLPGQSLLEEREKLVENAFESPLLLALFAVVLAGLECWRDYTNMKPNPILFTIVAAGAVFYAIFRVLRALPKLRNLRLGLEGERVVGQFLERCREQGFIVFHDVVGSGFNVDHVLVGPAGVFAIETKTWSKPTSGRPCIEFDGEFIKRGGVAPDRDPVVQAKAQASWLRSVLQETTGKSFPVHPVIVFPGWFIENTNSSLKSIWVLEPKALPAFLSKEPVRLPSEDVKLASYHLSRLIRVHENSAR